jgi:hypothetical protein
VSRVEGGSWAERESRVERSEAAVARARAEGVPQESAAGSWLARDGRTGSKAERAGAGLGGDGSSADRVGSAADRPGRAGASVHRFGGSLGRIEASNDRADAAERVGPADRGGASGLAAGIPDLVGPPVVGEPTERGGAAGADRPGVSYDLGGPSRERRDLGGSASPGPPSSGMAE